MCCICMYIYVYVYVDVDVDVDVSTHSSPEDAWKIILNDNSCQYILRNFCEISLW